MGILALHRRRGRRAGNSNRGRKSSRDIFSVKLCFEPLEDRRLLSVWSNPNLITIPAGEPSTTSGPANPYPSNISVSGLSGTIADVNVSLNGFTHTYPDDVDILLVGPASQKVIVLSDVGGGTDISGVNLTIDDAATNSLPDASVLTSGTFKPTDFETGDSFSTPAPAGPYASTLATFNGTNPNGTWSLYVYDDASIDYGSFSGGWALSITTSVDTTPPTLTNRIPAPGSTIISSSLNIDMTFSEAVQGVDATDLVLTGTAAGSTIIGTPINTTGNTWRFPVTNLADGTLDISLAPDANDIEDLAGNDLANISWNYTIDITPPTVTDRVPAPNSAINSSSVNIDVTFSEAVQGVDATDLALTGTAAGLATTGTPTNTTGNAWRFPVTNLADGTLDISLAPDANDIEDLAGNDLANISWNYTIDITPPTVADRIPTPNSAINSSTVNIDVTFSETVQGVDATDLVLTGTAAGSATKGTPTNITGNTWRFPVSNLVNGTLDISLAPDANDIEDLVGNDLANITWNYTIDDTTPPTVSNRLPAPGSMINSSSINIDVTFSERVQGVDASDLAITGTAAGSAIIGTPINISSNVWRFPVSNLVTGSLDINLAPDINDIEDMAGNDLANLTWSYSIDITPPTVIDRVPAPGSMIESSSINIDVTFSEAVQGVDATDLVLTGTAAGSATKGTPTNITGNTWRFPVSNLVNGPLNISLAPDANDIKDLAGNDLANVTWSFTKFRTIYSANMDANPGWTMSGQWAFGHPIGQGGALYPNPDPSNGYTGSNIYGVNLASDYNTTLGGPYYLTTTAINCTGSTGVTLAFRRWLNTDYQPYAAATIEVSNNGTTWTNIYSNPTNTAVTDSSWQLMTYNISPYADNRATVYVRWGYQVLQSGALAYSGWNIDDVTLTTGTSSGTFSNATSITLPTGAPSTTSGPASPYPSNIIVSGLSGTVTDVNVSLNGFTHTYPDDVDVLLVGPAGQKVIVLSDVGGNTAISAVNLTLDDMAASYLPDSNILITGAFKPTNMDATSDAFSSPAPAAPYAYTLATFNGTNPNGTWSLYVYDDTSSNYGSFSGGWSLSFTTTGAVISQNPGTPDLINVSDTGFSNTDNLTNLDNSATSKQLQFSISNTVAGAVVTVYADGTSIGSATATGTTTIITTNGTFDLTDGPHKITSRQTEQDKSASSDSTELRITIDPIVPATPNAPDLQAGSDSGISSTDNITNDNTPSFTLPVLPYFRFYRDGSKISGDYQTGTTYTPSAQSDGTFNYAISAVDAAGNASALSSGLSVSIDTIPPGLLDYSFGTEGKVITPFGSQSSWVSGTVIQPDGKIVVAGGINNPDSYFDFALARYNPDGSLDTTFGTGGKVITSFNNYGDQAYAVAIQADGKIIAVGCAAFYNGTMTNPYFAIVRYNTDGTLDNSFGSGGKVTTNFPQSGEDIAYAVSIQPDGKIVVGGETMPAGDWQFGLARYNPDGTLDTTFGGDGMVATEIEPGPGSFDKVYALTIQPDGKIIAAGTSELNTLIWCFTAARYNTDGSLDTTFSTDGIVQVESLDTSNAFAVAVLENGKILLGGGGDSGPALVRLNTDGSLDTSFDGDGYVIISGGGDIQSIAVQPDGRIVTAGSTDWSNGINTDFYILRFNSDGSLDTGFASGGKLRMNFGPYSEAATSICLQEDGNIIVSGHTGLSGGQESFAVAGLLTTTISAPDLISNSDSGVSDTDNITNDNTPTFDFSAGPYFRFYRDGALISGLYESGSSFTAPNQDDGTYSYYVIAVDDAGNQSSQSSGLTMTIDTVLPTLLNSGGTLDELLGGSGIVTTMVGDGHAYSQATAIQPDGKILLIGRAGDGDNADFAVVRYNVDGTLDTGFGSGGKVITAIGTSTDVATAVVVQDDGKIILVGQSYYNSSDMHTALIRYNSDGSLDAGFGSGGKVVVTIGSAHDGPRDVCVLGDGKILVTGFAGSSSRNDFFLARFLGDGSLDATFGTSGTVITAIGAGSTACALDIQADGKIVVAGTAATISNYSANDFALVRYTADGILDTSFGTNGRIMTDIGMDYDLAEDMVIQGDGRIVVVGTSHVGGRNDFSLTRYDANGTLDNSFGSGGIVTSAIGPDNDEASGVAIQADSKIVLVGTSYGVSGYSIVVARYNTNGSADTSFGVNGYITTSLPSGGTFASGMAIQADGRIVVSGNTVNAEDGHDFVLTRYSIEPLVALVFELQTPSDSGVSHTDNITNDNTPTFAVTGTNGNYWRIYRNGVVISQPPTLGDDGGVYKGSGDGNETFSTQADGTYRYSITAVDAAGNESSMSQPLTVTIDTTPPTVTINQAASQADPTDSSPLNFTVVFSEPVSDFTDGDVALSGTAGGILTATVTPINAITYNVAVSGMTSNGTVIASLLAGVAHDTAGNSSVASTSTDNTVVYDTVIHTWSGGSLVNNLWSTPENWVGDVAPTAGDNLIFPADAAQMENFNDYPSGTVFGSITVSGSDYHFQNNDSSASIMQLQSGTQLEVDKIVTDTLTLGAGATLTIAPIAGGPLAAKLLHNTLTKPLAADAILPVASVITDQVTVTSEVAKPASTATPVAAEPLAASTVLATPVPASSAASALASSDSLSNTVLDAVAVPTEILPDAALPMRLVESTPARLIDTAINRLPSQSPIYSWIGSTALPKISENWLGNSLSWKQTSNANTTVYASFHNELPSGIGKIDKHPITPAINSRQTHLAALQTSSRWTDADTEADFDIAQQVRARKYSKQLEKAIDEVLSEEDAIPALL